MQLQNAGSLRTGFVGRDAEVRLVWRGIRNSSSGKGCAFLVSGEPGIGKSRFIQELGNKARIAGIRVLHGQCAPHVTSDFESIWVKIIANLGADGSACGGAVEIPSGVESARSACLDSAMAENQRPGSDDAILNLEVEPGLVWSVCRVLAQASRSGPVLLLIEDLHNADQFSLELLTIVARLVREMPLVIVATCRSGGEREGLIGHPSLAVFASEATHIQLVNLDETQTAELLREILDRTPDDDHLRRVWEATAGNPLFIMETAQLARSHDGSGVHASAPIPSAVRAAICDRLEAVSPPARRLLTVASVLGAPFDASMMSAMIDMEREPMESALVELERSRLLRHEGPERYDFTQRLVADVLYVGQPASARAALHYRIANALEKLNGRDGGAHAAEIARHLAQCIDSSTAEKTIRYAIIAAKRGAADHDFALAERMYSIALSAMELGGTADDGSRCDLLTALGSAQGRIGAYRSAEESLRTAAELADRLCDVDRLAKIVVSLPAWCWPSPAEANGLAVLLAERTLVIEGQWDKGLRAMVLARLAAELSSFQAQEHRSVALFASALDLVSPGGDASVELYVRCCGDHLVRQPGQLHERIANGTDIVRLATEVGDYASFCVGSRARCAAFVALGDIHRADREAHVIEQTAAMSHEPLHRGLSLAYKGGRAAMDGKFADANLAFASCRALAAEHKLAQLSDACWPAMMLALGEEGRLSELEYAAEETVQRRPNAAACRALLSWLKIDLGNTADALFHFERLAGDGFANLSKSDGSLVGLAALAEVCIGLNKLEQAETLYGLLAPHADLNVALGIVAVFGSTETYLGKLAAGLARFDAAIAHFERAIEMNRHIGARPWSACAGYELARVLILRGEARDLERARELSAGIEVEAARLGMMRLLNKVRQLREQLDGRALTVPERGCRKDTVALSGHAARNGKADLNGTEVAVPMKGRLDEGRSFFPAASGLVSSGESQVAIFQREGEFWAVGCEGRVFFLRHRKGLALLCKLLRNPGRQFYAADLTSEGDEGSTADPSGRCGNAVESDLGPALDATAKQSYKERFRELGEELEEAREFNDPERVARIEEEREFLARELARAVGLFGRDRKLGSEAERARQRVTFTIKSALRVISEHDACFGHHLAQAIRTGTFCTYVPGPGKQFDWRF